MKFTALDYVILIVADLDRAVAFYTGVLGIPLAQRAEAYAQFDTGTTRLGLYTREAMSETLALDLTPPARHSPGFEIGFKVPDVDAAYATLVERGAQPQTPPTTRPWGQRTAYIRDPDGHLIELAQDLSVD